MRTSVLLLVSLAALVPASPAGAVPILEGDARLTLDGDRTRLPIVRGNIEETRGTLRLQGRPVIGGRRLKGLVVELDRRGSITAKVGGLRRKVLALDGRRAEVRRGRSPRLRIVGIGVRSAGVLKGRDLRGTLVIVAAPRFIRLVAGRTELMLAESFRDLLQSEGVTPAGAEGSPITEEGAIAFPVSAGRLNLGERLSGTIDHGGGIAFSHENTPKLRVTDLLLDVRRGVIRARLNEGERSDVFRSPLPAPAFADGIASFEDVEVALHESAAPAFNEALESEAFTGGLAVGALTLRAEID